MTYKSLLVVISIFLMGVRTMGGEIQGLENVIATQYSLKRSMVQVDIKDHVSQFFPLGSSIRDAEQQLARSNFSIVYSKKFANMIIATRELKRTSYSFDEVRIVLDSSGGVIVSLSAALLTHAL
jgi:hypothetical protein